MSRVWRYVRHVEGYPHEYRMMKLWMSGSELRKMGVDEDGVVSVGK